MLEAREVGRRIAGTDNWLLRGISLAVRAGQRLALVGPSGAGKTLLLRSLALLDPLDAGEIRWQGATVRGGNVPKFRRQVVYLHQRPVLGEGTVESNLRHPFDFNACRQDRFDRERIVALLGTLGRDASFLAKQQRDLSGGEAQLVALLRAIQLDPLVLLLDEPTAALDAATVHAAEQLVARWFGERPAERASLWVSHDHAQTRRIADQTIQIDLGRIVRSENEPS